MPGSNCRFVAVMPTNLQHLKSYVETTPQLESVVVMTPAVSDPAHVLNMWEMLEVPKVSIGVHVTGHLAPGVLHMYEAMRPSVVILEPDVVFGGLDAYSGLFASATVFVKQELVADVERWALSTIWRPPFLIEPLHPLRDDLDLLVYHQFEKDFVKYSQYERAIAAAMKENPATILVVGPGRGPLVDVVVKHNHGAAITAIEKNKKCWDTLTHKNTNSWNNSVNLVCEDVRDQHISFFSSFDLVISELLGSFGCNELCPEILARFTGTMIPASYTSYLAPVYSTYLSGSLPDPVLSDAPYYELAPVKEVFTFTHPSPLPLSRSVTWTFPESQDLRPVNALRGTFKATLYGDIRIGITHLLPHEYTDSWFPIYFPFEKILWQDLRTITFERISNTLVSYRYTVNLTSHTYTVEIP